MNFPAHPSFPDESLPETLSTIRLSSGVSFGPVGRTHRQIRAVDSTEKIRIHREIYPGDPLVIFFSKNENGKLIL